MATKFIKYENALLKIAGQDILANSATLSIEASLDPVVDVTGEVIRYVPNAPVRGTLSFTHYCTGSFHDFLNPTTAIEHTGEPFNGSFAGVEFGSGYIKSLSFDVRPFQPIVFNSEIDIYGELTQLTDGGDSSTYLKDNQSYPENFQFHHGLKSYLAGDDLGVNNKVSFSYSAQASRNPVVTIGNELPYRVTKENVKINMSIEGEDFGNILKFSGNQASIRANIYGVYGDSVAQEFGCTGQVYANELTASAGGYMQGNLSIGQEYLTGKAAV